MDLAQMLMFQQLGQSAPLRDKNPVPMADENPILNMMRGPASVNDESALQLKKLQVSGSIPASAPMSKSDEAYENYVNANSKGLESQRSSLEELAKLVKENQTEVNPLQNLFTAAHDTVTGGSKLQTLMTAQQASKDKFLQQNDTLQKARGDLTDKETDIEKAKLTYAQAQEKAAADREQFKLLYGLKQQGAENSGDNRTFKQEQAIFQDWNKHDVTKASNNVGTGYEKVIAAANDPSPAGSLSLIFGYMKMLDPGSVVREAEFKTAEEARGALARLGESGVVVPAFVVQGIQRLQGKEGTLLAEQRADFMNQAKNVYGAQLARQKGIDKSFESRARDLLIDPARVVKSRIMFGDSYDAKPKDDKSADPTYQRLLELRKKAGK